MGFCRFLEVNDWRDAGGTIVASTEASALPVEATQDPDRSYPWRSLSETADQDIVRDLGSAKVITFFAIANLRRQNAGAVELFEGGIGGSPGVWNLVATIPAQDDETRMATALVDAVAARHWKLQWTNGDGGVADYAEAGYIGLGSYFEPSRLCQLPIEWSIIDPSVQRASVDGQVTTTTRTSYAAGSLAFVHVNESDLTRFRSMRRSLGVRVPFFFVLDSTLSNQQWLMRFGSELQVDRRHVPGRYDVSFAWEETR